MSKKTDTPTLQQNMEKLDTLLAWFDGDEFTLEESVEKFNQAKQLAQVIETQLDAFDNEVTVVKRSLEDA